MTYKITYTKRFEKHLRTLSKNEKDLIKKKVASHKRINWECSRGHKWSAVIKERTKFKGNMCPECRKLEQEFTQ